MLKISFSEKFANFSGASSINIIFPEYPITIFELLPLITKGNELFFDALNRSSTIVTINDSISPKSQLLEDHDFISFFEPLSGG